MEDDKDRKRKEREEEDDAVAKQNFRRFRCFRFGTKEPDRAQDDAGLAPEGFESLEATWPGEDADWDGTALVVEALAAKDFAGRYEVLQFIDNGSVGIPPQGKAYVEITSSGEGKLFVDRTTSGYFWLSVVDVKQQHVELVWRRSRLSCEHALSKWREEELAKGATEEEIESQAEVEQAGQDYREIFTDGYICYWRNDRDKKVVGAKDKLGVLLCYRWEDGYQQFVLRKVQLADGTAITYDDGDAQEDEDEDEDEFDDDDDEGDGDGEDEDEEQSE